MSSPTRKVTVKFDGDAKGLIAAGKQGEHAIDNFRKQAQKSVANVDLSSGFTDALGALPSQLKGAAIVAAVGIGAVMAPALASAIISGVLLAVGGGVLAAGIVAAAQDQRVIRAWKHFGDHAAKTFQRFGQPFIGPLTRAADTFVAALDRAEPTIRAIGRTMAPIIDKLAPGLAGIFEKMLPGVARVAEASLPFLERLLDPRLGESIGKFFENIAKGAPNALIFFDRFMSWVESTLPKLGGFLTWLSDLGAKMENFSNTELSNLKTALDSFKDDTLEGVKKGFDDIKVSVDSNSESWREMKDNVSEFITFAGPAFKALAEVIGTSVAAAIDWLATLGTWISRILQGLTKIDDLYRRLTGKEVLKQAEKQKPLSPGGFQGFAAGGVGKGIVMTGERGRELVDLGGGGRVYNNHETEKMLATGSQAAMMSGSSGPAAARPIVNVTFQPSGNAPWDQFVQAMLPYLLKSIRVDGGDLSAFGAA